MSRRDSVWPRDGAGGIMHRSGAESPRCKPSSTLFQRDGFRPLQTQRRVDISAHIVILTKMAPVHLSRRLSARKNRIAIMFRIKGSHRRRLRQEPLQACWGMMGTFRLLPSVFVIASLLTVCGCGGGKSSPLPAVSEPTRAAVVTATTVPSAVASIAVATPTPLSDSDATVFAQLTARPLHLPTLRKGEACPRTPSTPIPINVAPVLGNGPLYPSVGFANATIVYDPQRVEANGTLPWKTLWLSAPIYHAPSIIRGEQIDGPKTMEFFNEEDGSRSRELRFATNTQVSSGGIPYDWRQQPSLTYFPGPGCYGYQVDGIGFSEVIVVEVHPT